MTYFANAFFGYRNDLHVHLSQMKSIIADTNTSDNIAWPDNNFHFISLSIRHMDDV